MTLSDLLQAAADAGPGQRIEFRDPIAAEGEAAVDAMCDWLGDERLAAFAIRVLERIGHDPANRDQVVATLLAVDCRELSAGLAADIDWALNSLGVGTSARRAGSKAANRAAMSRAGSPGVAGRGYWVMRTSQWERPYIWSEAQHGRLRQGWGWNADANLDAIAAIVRRGGELTEEQRMSWRSRRMNTSERDGIRFGDIVLAPNLPEWGCFSLFRVTGSYEYSLDEPRRWGERFGHVLPVELLAEGIDRRSPSVSDGLRAMLRPQSRLFNITSYGGDVERLLGTEPTP